MRPLLQRKTSQLIIVSGLPRSGTSLAMQMLCAGGLNCVTDEEREPDEHNPKGYYEYTPVKSLYRDSGWVKDCHGKALKVVAPLLPYLPPELSYKTIFMSRPLGAIVASQQKMLLARGFTRDSNFHTVERLLAREVERAKRWLFSHPNNETLFLDYQQSLENPLKSAERLKQFLELDLDINAMAEEIEPNLCHQTSPETSAPSSPPPRLKSHSLQHEPVGE